MEYYYSAIIKKECHHLQQHRMDLEDIYTKWTKPDTERQSLYHLIYMWKKKKEKKVKPLAPERRMQIARGRGWRKLRGVDPKVHYQGNEKTSHRLGENICETHIR